MENTNDYLKFLFKDYCTFSKEDNSKEYISEECHNQFLIFLREYELNEKEDVYLHIKSYSQTINSANDFAKKKNGTNCFIAATAHKEIQLAMREPIPVERVQAFLEFLETIDDRFVPRGRDHIFQRFKQKIVDNFNVRMSLDGLSKTAVYYVLMNEIIIGLRHQFQDSKDMPYTQNGIHHSYKLAKLLASLWIAIVIPDGEISESIFHHFNDVYTNKWILDGMPSMMMAYIAFGGGEQRIIEFEASQRYSREVDSGKQSEVDSGKQSEADSKKTSKQKRQQANRGTRSKNFTK